MVRAGAMPWMRLGAGKIEIGFVQRQRLDQRRQLPHQAADFPRDFDIKAHARLDDHGVGAQLAGLEHRHGRAHAIAPRDIAGGGDHAARAAAHDHRHCRPGRDRRAFRSRHKRRRNPDARWQGFPVRDGRECACRRSWGRALAGDGVRKTVAAEGGPLRRGHLALIQRSGRASSIPQPGGAAHAAGIAMHVLDDARRAFRREGMASPPGPAGRDKGFRYWKARRPARSHRDPGY